MCQRVAACLHFVTTVYEMMWVLCRIYGVEHNRKVAAGRVFHTGCDIKTTDRQTVLLILDRTCTDGNVGEKIFDIPPVFRVEHLICTG